MNIRLPVSVMVLTGLLLASTAASQDGPASREPGSGPNRQSPTQNQVDLSGADPESEKLLSFEFKGGTAEQYVATVRKAASDANIVTIGNLSTYDVPATQLRNVTVWSALEVLRSLPRDPTAAQSGVEVSWNSPTPRNMRASGIAGAEAAPVYVVTSLAFDRGSKKSGDDLTVMEIGELLDGGMKAADVLTAVEAALSMQDAAYEPAEMRFHEATALLIIRGHPMLTNTAQRVIGQLHEKAKRHRQQSRLQENLESASRKALETEALLNDCRAENQQRIQQLTEFKTRAEFLERELAGAREQFASANEQITELRRVVQTLGIEQRPKKSDNPQ